MHKCDGVFYRNDFNGLIACECERRVSHLILRQAAVFALQVCVLRGMDAQNRTQICFYSEEILQDNVIFTLLQGGTLPQRYCELVSARRQPEAREASLPYFSDCYTYLVILLEFRPCSQGGNRCKLLQVLCPHRLQFVHDAFVCVLYNATVLFRLQCSCFRAIVRWQRAQRACAPSTVEGISVQSDRKLYDLVFHPFSPFFPNEEKHAAWSHFCGLRPLCC